MLLYVYFSEFEWRGRCAGVVAPYEEVSGVPARGRTESSVPTEAVRFVGAVVRWAVPYEEKRKMKWGRECGAGANDDRIQKARDTDPAV